MTAPTRDAGVPDLPVQLLATAPRPGVQHAQLRARGVHRRDGGWVVARPQDVAEALASPALSVAPPVAVDGTSPGDARLLQDRMARFTDPPRHAPRRAVLERLLPDSAALEAAASRRTSAPCRAGPGPSTSCPWRGVCRCWSWPPRSASPKSRPLWSRR